MDPAGFRADLSLLPESLDRLAAALPSPLPDTGRTLVLGMGSSAYAAVPAVRAVRAAGGAAWCELASTAALPPPAPDLTVVAVSATGASAEVLATTARYAGTGRLVAVTEAQGSPLAELADLVVPLRAGTEAGGVACRSYRHTVAVLLALLAPRAVPDLAAACRRAAAASAALLDSADDWLPAAADALAGPHLAVTLAPAERLGSAQQAALMLREGPRRPAYAAETADWSHVDVYLTLTLDYRALLFAGSAWDAAALDWMRQRGTTYVAVGADLPGAAVCVRHPYDDDPWVRLLTEVLVGELVAHRWWAADPDFDRAR